MLVGMGTWMESDGNTVCRDHRNVVDDGLEGCDQALRFIEPKDHLRGTERVPEIQGRGTRAIESDQLDQIGLRLVLGIVHVEVHIGIY